MDSIPGSAVTKIKIGDKTDRGVVRSIRTTEHTDGWITIEVRVSMEDFMSNVLSDWIPMRTLTLYVA